MNSKIRYVIILVTILSFLYSGMAFAGSVYDYGTVPGTPPVGEVNWTAWLDDDIPSAGDPPGEILTEDNTNSDVGIDQGYQSFIGVIRWLMQVENFSNAGDGKGVTIMLGGLGSSSGNVWRDTFNWDESTEDFTDQGQASSFSTDTCPVINAMSWTGSSYTFNWSGVAGTYYVYRSTQESGCCDGTPNGASNGRYQYLATVNAASGSGTYTDSYSGNAWYLVIHADSSGDIDGCHSEIDIPTAVMMGDFFASPQAGLNLLEWQTLSEHNLTGFNLYRSESKDGQKEKLNDSIIFPLNPGGFGETDYEFIDRIVQPGTSYYYWLEPVDITGPLAQIQSNLVRALYMFYLQLVAR